VRCLCITHSLSEHRVHAHLTYTHTCNYVSVTIASEEGLTLTLTLLWLPFTMYGRRSSIRRLSSTCTSVPCSYYSTCLCIFVIIACGGTPCFGFRLRLYAPLHNSPFAQHMHKWAVYISQQLYMSSCNSSVWRVYI